MSVFGSKWLSFSLLPQNHTLEWMEREKIVFIIHVCEIMELSQTMILIVYVYWFWKKNVELW
jgi:hypothetical protein